MTTSPSAVYTRGMTDNRKGGIALIIGMFGTIVTMALHPAGPDLFRPGRFQAVALMGTSVHSLALLCLPFLFLGALALSRRLNAPDRYALVALVFYGFALFAVMIAAVASGLIAPSVGRQILNAEASSNLGLSSSWRVAFNFNGMINQAFAKLYVVGSCIAIFLWSLAMRRQRPWIGYAIYGFCLASIAVLALVSGYLKLDVAGFGMLALAQAIWFVGVGSLMSRDVA